MPNISNIFSTIFSLFQWWIVIAPWELGIRVRSGKKGSLLHAGIHFRIPGIDRFFVQGTRKRYANTPTQTITTSDGKTVTTSGGMSYSISDIELLYDTLGDAQDVIEIETMALVQKFISTHKFDEIITEDMERYINSNVGFEKYGLKDCEFKITDFVCVKTYRLINTNPKDYTTSYINTIQEKQITQQ